LSAEDAVAGNAGQIVGNEKNRRRRYARNCALKYLKVSKSIDIDIEINLYRNQSVSKSDKCIDSEVGNADFSGFK
jgi:hypothetical protein